MEHFYLLLALVTLANGDLYLHSMRGSNNRLNENSANRNNANRLFDSQNNNRGGYNAGDASDEAATDESEQYRMKYFQSSIQGGISTDGSGQSYLSLEWTNQHGCGGNEDTDPHKQNCALILQYMCQEHDSRSATGTALQDYFRNGISTRTQNYNRPASTQESQSQNSDRRAVDINRGYHEPWSWYDSCFVRERNGGLFTADQNLKANNGLGYSSAIYTRQNPNGNRHGYECPEERDYYPYFHPTPWKDIAVLTDNETLCSYYRNGSFNVQPYYECIEYFSNSNLRRPSRWNNAEDCITNGGTWTPLHNYLEKVTQYSTGSTCLSNSGNGIRHIWGIPYDSLDGQTEECLVALSSPDCQAAPWSRSNHLGNGREGTANNYTWILPYFPSGETKRCVFRMRYNISTDDFDPYRTTSAQNQDNANLVQSPVQQNPYVDIGAGLSPLRLAINTAQFGRIFQDRSHVFLLLPRPSGIDAARIYNLNVRGKRGNIVQTYPAVEYDFHPNTLYMQNGDLVHIQWTGSNTHNNGNPAGDGQAGDAGEGQGGTDRNNLVQIRDLDQNYPLPFEQFTMWTNTDIIWTYEGPTDFTPNDMAISMMSSGYYLCTHSATCPRTVRSPDDRPDLNPLLNNAPASHGGALLRFQPGTYHYMCTRNNNFSNRSQKGTLIVR